jgi:hypothetical protein
MTAPFLLTNLRAQTSPVKVQPPSAVTNKAKATSPPVTAQQKNSIGSGQTSVKTSGQASYWTEEIDVDGNGTTETTDMLWDGTRKTLYMYTHGSYTCTAGGQGTGAMVMAVYGSGNAAGKPAGAGWYLVNLDPNQCGSQAGGLFGCRFDTNGNATECGAAVVDPVTSEVVITKQ